MVLLNPVFSCCKSLLSFSADKVTTRTYNLQSIVANVAFVGAAIAGISGTFPCGGTASVCYHISQNTIF